MKRLTLCVSALLISVLFLWASPSNPIELNQPVNFQSFQFRVNGQWLPDVHPLHVGANNYTEVKNLRPTKTGYETVEGYSKINTALTDTPLDMHHFSKGAETHLIAKVNNSGTYELVQNTTAIPSQGDFAATALTEVSSGDSSFANGPRGVMFYADGQYNLAWGGDELEPGAFFIGDDANSLTDYTDQVSNDLTSETAIVGNAGDDAYAILLTHMEGADASTTFTDDGETGHTVTANGDAQIDTDFYKFGVSSGIFDGTGDYLSIPDHDNWNYGTNEITFDVWVRFNAVTGKMVFYHQGLNTNYVAWIQDHDNSILSFVVMSSGSRLMRLYGTWAPVANTWYHVAVIRGWGGSANGWAITVQGTSITTDTQSVTLPDVATSTMIGRGTTTNSIDFGSTGHGLTFAGSAAQSVTQSKYGGGSLRLPGAGSYATMATSSDFNITGQTNFTLEAWVRHDSHASNETYFCRWTSANAYYRFIHVHGTGLGFDIKSGGVTVVTLSGGEISDSNWHHVAVIKVGSAYGLYLDGTQTAYTSNGTEYDVGATLYMGVFEGGASNAFTGYMDEPRIQFSNIYSAAPVVGLSDTITPPAASVAYDSNTKLLYYFDFFDFNGWLDEYRITKGIPRWTANFTPNTIAYYDGGDYFYIASPYKLDGVKPYVQDANQVTSTLSGAVWAGAGWSTLTLTDGTASGGITLAQTGDVTWAYSEDPKVLYIGDITQYVYRFALSAGSASLYKLTVSAPFQTIRDVWNESPRTCISFQASRTSVYEDYTFPVHEKDSTSSSAYAATIGGIGSSDHIIFVFDDRSMAVKFDMVPGLVNVADAQISSIQYWNGSAYTSVGYFNDETLDSGADSSFSQSGVVSWNPPPKSSEHRQELFGVSGYAYKIVVDGTLTTGTGYNGTSVDLVTGVTAPLEITGSDLIGTYNGRLLLIEGNRIDYSQTDTPWVFNGVDSSDDERLSIYFGDDNDIVAIKSIFNRYGSNLIEGLAVFKKNSLDLLTGSQPYPQYSDPFIVKSVSKNIGCAAPMTVSSYQMELSDGLRMGILLWLDFSGPYIYNGADPQRIEGIGNYFDPSNSDAVNTSYINTSFAYIDSVNDQWNLVFPSGASTVPNKWVVYDLIHKKWFEKTPSSYPMLATHVVDTDGTRYNYGFLSTGQMLRLDNGQTWDGTAIAQNIKTGYFSPPVEDDLGFWSRSEIRALRLLSADITEDKDVTATIYNDGSLSSNSLTIPLNVSGVVSKNTVGSGNLNEQADYFQINFAASTSTNKWTPLAWGYKAIKIRDD